MLANEVERNFGEWVAVRLGGIQPRRRTYPIDVDPGGRHHPTRRRSDFRPNAIALEKHDLHTFNLTRRVFTVKAYYAIAEVAPESESDS